MTVITGIVIGLIVGAGVMFFIYRNNTKGFNEREEALKNEIDSLKKKFDIIRGK